jgi:predicted DNA-binding protein (UPF0251 family)
VAFERIADRKIREAMQAGEFDNLPHGKRVDLEEYFKLPADLRMAYSILKSAGCLPEEVEMLREVDRLQTELDAATSEAARATLRKALADARLRIDVALERKRAERSSPSEF